MHASVAFEPPSTFPNVPKGQPWHDCRLPLPECGPYDPIEQGMHEEIFVAPSFSLYVPSGHLRQADELLDWFDGLYVPLGHNRQLAWFGVLLYCPAGHAIHNIVTVSKKVPGRHVTVESQEELPVKLVFVPGAHAMQDCCSALLENEPIGHTSQ